MAWEKMREEKGAVGVFQAEKRIIGVEFCCRHFYRPACFDFIVVEAHGQTTSFDV